MVRLLCQWIDFTTRTYSDFGFEKGRETNESWVACLLEAVFDSTKDDSWFLDKTQEWLQALSQRPATQFRDQKRLVIRLTCDLDELYGIKEKSPQLIGAICQESYEDRKLTQSRHAWLQRMHADRLVAPVMECWRECAIHLVPDPSSVSKADYTAHARWLDVVREIHLKDYQSLIETWRTEHKRRTNLWKAIRARGLPH